MRFLVIGLGSMGKRRVRNLQALGYRDVAGFDLRADRREEARVKYGITVYEDVEQGISGHRPDALVISTSPAHHMTYAWRGLDLSLPCFIEASVVDADRILALSEAAEKKNVVFAPSCTMRYFPGPKLVKRLLAERVIGKPLSVHYHTGQYLPDWHPWEKIEDFYVSDRATGGCREIVPFELTWLDDVFGDSEALACVKGKLTDMPADIDDIYYCLLRYPGGVLANVTVDVISRPVATRELRILGSAGELVMSADDNCVRYTSGLNTEWTKIDLGGGTVESGYINPEEPYIAEMSDFITSVREADQSLFPNSLKDDWRVLQTLYSLEKLAETVN
ncbi:Gfo/Idh/MocA family protein [Herbaspirillum sp. NPDC101397]|uniref:Gfo/Idh/MocA family protein n=1 Tax=Herbaspirillum sp. NPDC101397 TaxID=3364006 RepID=UPI00383B5BA1